MASELSSADASILSTCLIALGLRATHSSARVITSPPTSSHNTLMSPSLAVAASKVHLSRRRRNISQTRSTTSRTQISSRMSLGWTAVETRSRRSPYSPISSPSMIGEGPKSSNGFGRRVADSAGKLASVLVIRIPRRTFLFVQVEGRKGRCMQPRLVRERRESACKQQANTFRRKKKMEKFETRLRNETLDISAGREIFFCRQDAVAADKPLNLCNLGKNFP